MVSQGHMLYRIAGSRVSPVRDEISLQAQGNGSRRPPHMPSQYTPSRHEVSAWVNGCTSKLEPFRNGWLEQDSTSRRSDPLDWSQGWPPRPGRARKRYKCCEVLQGTLPFPSIRDKDGALIFTQPLCHPQHSASSGGQLPRGALNAVGCAEVAAGPSAPRSPVQRRVTFEYVKIY